MFNYIKWELKSIYRKYAKILIVIAVIMGLIEIMPFSDGIVTKAILFAFIISMLLLSISTYVLGTKKVVDTFRKPTFLLESMISIPPSKLLLAKYLLAIIINVICALLLVLGLSIIVARETNFIEFLDFLEIPINFETLEVLVTLLISSTLFTSTVTLCFVWLRSMFPKMKGSLFLGVIVWYLGMVFLSAIFAELEVESTLVFNMIELVIIVLSYFGTFHLIENKLEIYN